MNPRPPAGGLTSCCGLRPKPLKPPTTVPAPPSRAARNYLDPEDLALAEEDAEAVEPVYAASRRRPARGDAPGNAAAAGADRGDDEGDEDAAPGGAGARRGSGGGASGASFFAPSAAVAGRDHVAVIQGASRGIGLELVRQLLERPDLKARSGGRVVATCRDPAGATELQELLAHYGKERLTILRLDVLDEATIEDAAEVVEQRFGRCDLLINTSGVLHIPGELQPETALAAVTADAMTYAYRVNAIGPTLVLKAFAPLLRRTAAASAARSGSSVAPTVAANLSARVSSIRENRLGGWHSYRASKAALNMLTKSAAVELGQGGAPVICLLLHPGTVATDLSRPFNRNVPAKMLFTAETAVRCLLHVIAKAQPEDSGKLLCWDGTTVDW